MVCRWQYRLELVPSLSPLWLTYMCRILVLYCLNIAYKYPPRMASSKAGQLRLTSSLFHVLPLSLDRLTTNRAGCAVVRRFGCAPLYFLSVFHHSRLPQPAAFVSPTPTAFRVAAASRLLAFISAGLATALRLSPLKPSSCAFSLVRDHALFPQELPSNKLARLLRPSHLQYFRPLWHKTKAQSRPSFHFRCRNCDHGPWGV